MISERQVSSKPFSSHNDVTGDSLTSKVGSQEAYASGWDLIWGKKESEKVEINLNDQPEES